MMATHIISKVTTIAISVAAYINFRKVMNQRPCHQQQPLPLPLLIAEERKQPLPLLLIAEDKQQPLLEEKSVSKFIDQDQDQDHDHDHDQPPHIHNLYSYIVDLPIDMVHIIVSKLDIVTLCRWAAALPQYFHPMIPILPTLTSLTMTVPSSLLLPPDKLTLTSDYLNPEIQILYEELLKVLQIHILKPSLPIPRLLFMKRFSSLESLSVDLPPPVLLDSDYLTNPKAWFRWDSHFNVKTQNLLVFYYISIHATMVKPQEEEEEEESSHPIITEYCTEKIKQVLHVSFCHLKFHANTILSLFPSFYSSHRPQRQRNPHPKLRTIVSKDMGMNGQLTLYSNSDEEKKKNKFAKRFKFCYLSEELDLTSSSGSNLKIKDASLLFMYHGDVVLDNSRTKKDTEYIIRHCLDRGDYPRKELKEAVTKILSHPDTRHLIHTDTAMPTQDTLIRTY